MRFVMLLFTFQASAPPPPARPGSPPRGLKNILASEALTDEYRGFLAGLDSELETNTRGVGNECCLSDHQLYA